MSIGVAESNNCVEWKQIGNCMEAGEAGRFDSGGVSARCVLRDPTGAGWLMYFEAQDENQRHTIGRARSTDGLRWERDDVPVLEPSGEAESWDGGAVARPWMVPIDDGKACLYYVGRSKSTGVQGIGMAMSDGTDWTRFARVNAR